MNIAIIGAGNIGSDMAALWTHKGHNVTITARNMESLADLTSFTQKCVILKDHDIDELSSLIYDNDLILVIPSSDNPNEFDATFLDLAQTIRRIALEKTSPHRLIYISSTMVYGDHRGLWVDEKSKLKAKSEQGQAMIETEQMFQSLEELKWHVCILRLAEVYGRSELMERIRALQGQTLFESGKNFSNMVHHDDVTAAILFALRRRLNGIYNVADDDHPTRQDLYHQIVEKLGIPPIRWSQKTSDWRGGNKRISNHKIKAKGFVFLHPHREID